MLTADMLIPPAVFVTITLGTWIALSALSNQPRRAEDRLRRLLLGGADRQTVEAGVETKQAIFQAKVTAAARKLGQSVRPSDEAELGKVRIRLLTAGFRQEQAVTIFYGIKVLGLLAGLAVSVPAIVLHLGMTQSAMTMALGAAGVGLYVPDFLVGRRVKRRAESIFLGLPDALDLMVVCVEAGLGLDAAMRRVTGELAQSSPVLCEELAIANFQLQMGRPRKDVLRDLGTRTGVDDVRALASVIIQAERFGTSIGAALRVQSDAMRLRRRQLAEERAAKTAVKIMIPLILFIFPGVFVVLVGPAGIQMFEMLMKK
ncbi:MAG: type II secretion system F family protein [Isosphaeraceae bacterium]